MISLLRDVVHMLQLIGEALATIFGGLLLAALFCWCCWRLFELVHHPEVGVPLTALALWLPFRATIGSSDILEMALLFAVAASPVLWCIGRAGRGKGRR